MNTSERELGNLYDERHIVYDVRAPELAPALVDARVRRCSLLPRGPARSEQSRQPGNRCRATELSHHLANRSSWMGRA